MHVRGSTTVLQKGLILAVGVLILLFAPRVWGQPSVDAPPAPLALVQRSGGRDVPEGGVIREGRVELHVRVRGTRPGEWLRAEVEVRRGDEPFSDVTLAATPVIYTGDPITVVVPLEHLPPANYHWRARVRGAGGVSPWVPYGENSDVYDPPVHFPGVDFRSLWTPLRPLEREPVGYEGLVTLARWPFLRPGTEEHLVSSYDRTGGNWDMGNALYVADRRAVILDVKGPGQIDRIWLARHHQTDARLRIYLDDMTHPVVDMPLGEFFSGTHPPFVKPLVLEPDDTSGGYVSFVPMPFRERAKIELPPTVTTPKGLYFQVNYRTFASAEGIHTFTGREDYRLARWFLSRAGEFPYPGTLTTTHPISTTVLPGEEASLVQLVGGGSVREVRLRIPSLRPSLRLRPPTTDDMRCQSRGEIRFTLRVGPRVQTPQLVIRRYREALPQSALVSVDDVDLGVWFMNTPSLVYGWAEDAFPLPPELIRGKERIHVRLRVLGSSRPWCAARYRLKDGDEVWDELDVGNTTSEVAHEYTASPAFPVERVWAALPPVLTPHPESETLLRRAHIRVYADGMVPPLVDVPLGHFFGTDVGLTNVRSLLFKADPERGELTAYWPMPFASEMRIALFNPLDRPISVTGRVVTHDEPYAGLGTEAAYFRAHHVETATEEDRDVVLLDVRGRGHLVGTTVRITSDEVLHEDFHLLEGDERIYVDDVAIPLHGTGTEDFFNSGYYYDRGVYSQTLSGAPANWPPDLGLDQYRLLLDAPVPYKRHLLFRLEHGPANDREGEYDATVWYYGLDEVALVQTDDVDLGDDGSEDAHAMTVQGRVPVRELAHMYPPPDVRSLREEGRVLTQGARLTFTVRIQPENGGVRLHRRFDYGVLNQEASVFVDGEYVGEWYAPGSNASYRWSEDTFTIPAAFTRGKSRLHITLTNGSATPFTLYHMWVWTIRDRAWDLMTPTPTPTIPPTPTTTPTPTPTPTPTATPTPSPTPIPQRLWVPWIGR